MFIMNQWHVKDLIKRGVDACLALVLICTGVKNIACSTQFNVTLWNICLLFVTIRLTKLAFFYQFINQ